MDLLTQFGHGYEGMVNSVMGSPVNHAYGLAGQSRVLAVKTNAGHQQFR